MINHYNALHCVMKLVLRKDLNIVVTVVNKCPFCPKDLKKVSLSPPDLFLQYFSCLCTCISSWLLCRLKRERLGPYDWLSIPVPGGHDWMVVPGLEPETTYQFSILAQNKLGTGPFSEVVTVNTLGEYTHYCLTRRKGSNNKTASAGK